MNEICFQQEILLDMDFTVLLYASFNKHIDVVMKRLIRIFQITRQNTRRKFLRD